jgi:pyridoxamine 5'-phosphate oxidase-like protein
MWADERVVNVFGLARGRKTTMASARSLTTDRIWRALEKTAFAVISFVTPEGEPRSSGVVCAAARRHLYVVTASGSWKARQISDGDPVSVTVPVRRGGLLSLIAPIPPATVTFLARATVSSSWFSVHRVRVEEARFASTAGAQERLSARVGAGGRFPHLRRGVSLRDMAKPAAAIARVPVA